MKMMAFNAVLIRCADACQVDLAGARPFFVGV